MYLLYNNFRNIIKYLIISFFLILLQSYLPKIFISDSFEISLDIFLIYITLLVFSSETYLIIIFGFFVGLLQDFIIQVEMIGISSIIKSFTVYLIGITKNFNQVWSKKTKIFFIFFIYFFHFLIYYYVFVNDIFIVVIATSLFQSFFCFIIFYFIEKYFYNSEII